MSASTRAPLQKRPTAAITHQAGRATVHSTGPAAAIQDSPRMVAQRQRIADTFGGALQRKESPKAAPTGLPARLKTGIASLSGMDLSDVPVHENSAEPARIDALAFAQGRDIHLGPGQERHLPHEAWHIVQQRQGRVQATTQRMGARMNDAPALEREADVMGARAEGLGMTGGTTQGRVWEAPRGVMGAGTIQRTKVGKESRNTRETLKTRAGLTDEAANVFGELEGHWKFDNLVELGISFFKKPAERTAQEWAAIAAVPGMLNQAEAVCTFARIPAWNIQTLSALAGQFAAAQPPVRPANEWAAIAAKDGLTDNTAAVSTFARIAKWDGANLLALAEAFGANAAGHTAGEWVKIADVPELTNKEDTVCTFARIPNWSDYRLVFLVKEFMKGNAAKRAAADWAHIATRPGLNDRDDIVSAFARIPDWGIDHLATLAQSFCADNGQRTLEHWAKVAAVPTLKDRAKTASAFARVYGWDVANLEILVHEAEGNLAGITVEDWARVADTHKAEAHQTKELARLLRYFQGTDVNTIIQFVDTLRWTKLNDIYNLASAANGGAAAPAPPDLCMALFELVKAIGNGLNADTTTLVTSACTKFGVGQINSLVTFINRKPAVNKPSRVNALVNSVADHARFISIEGKVSLFARTAAPNKAPKTYAAEKLECNRWKHFYERHTYEYFDFSQIKDEQGIWKKATDLETELDTTITGLTAPQKTLLIAFGPKSIATATHVIGTEFFTPAGDKCIVQFYPTAGGNFDINFTKAEMTAIAQFVP